MPFRGAMLNRAERKSGRRSLAGHCGSTGSPVPGAALEPITPSDDSAKPLPLISGDSSEDSLEVHQHLSLAHVEPGYQRAVRQLEILTRWRAEAIIPTGARARELT
jgi:hypothetical protein